MSKGTKSFKELKEQAEAKATALQENKEDSIGEENKESEPESNTPKPESEPESITQKQESEPESITQKQESEPESITQKELVLPKTSIQTLISQRKGPAARSGSVKEAIMKRGGGFVRTATSIKDEIASRRRRQ